MSSLKDFLRQQRSGGGRSSGPRSEFYRNTTGNHVHRLFLVPSPNGEEMPCFQFLQHRLGRTDTVVCPRTFDPDADCEICDEVSMLYDEGEREMAGAKRAKKYSWFASLPKGEDAIHILQLPHGMTQDLFFLIAKKGGWKGDEPDWSNPDFAAAFEAGVGKVFGEKAYDFKYTYKKGGGFKTYTNVCLSDRMGAKKVLADPVPCLEEIFRRINRLNETRPQEPKAPPPRRRKRAKRKK